MQTVRAVIRYSAPGILPLVILLNVILMSTLLQLELFEKEREAAGKNIKTNFYMEGSQNIDLKDFSLLLNTDICNAEDIGIITIVSTAVPNKAGMHGWVYTR